MARRDTQTTSVTAPLAPPGGLGWLAHLPAAPARCVVCAHRHDDPPVHLGHGVSVSLCERHNTPSYLCAEGGLRFARQMTRIWTSAGALTRTRTRALGSHLRATHQAAQGKPRPGSYAYKRERQEVERRLAAGDDLAAVIADIRDPQRWRGFTPPSERTIRRWYHERRWLKPPIVETLKALTQPVLDALETLLTFASPGNFSDWISLTNATPTGQQRYNHHRHQQQRRQQQQRRRR